MSIKARLSNLKEQTGFTIVAVIFLMVGIGGMGIAVTQIVKNQNEVSVGSKQNLESYFTTQSGIEWAFQKATDQSWINTADLSGLNGTYTLPNSQQFTLSYAAGTDTLTSSSSVGGNSRHIEFVGFSAKLNSYLGDSGSECSFPSGVTYSDLTLEGSSSQTLTGPETVYFDKLELKDNATLTITGPVTILVKDDFKLKDDSVLTINGDVRIIVQKDAKFENDSQVVVNSGGNLYVDAGGDIEVKDSAQLNSGGDVDQVLLTATKDLKIKDDASVQAGAYGNNKFKLEDNAEFTGAYGSDGEIKLDGGTLSYDSAGGTGVTGAGMTTCNNMTNGLGNPGDNSGGGDKDKD